MAKIGNKSKFTVIRGESMANKMKFKTVYRWEETPALMTPNQAANLLELPEDTVRNYCQTNQLPACKIGKYWKIDKHKLMEQFGYAI